MSDESNDDPDAGDDTTAVINRETLQQYQEAQNEQTACLTIMSGPHVGRMITLEQGDVTVGRGRDCDLRISDEKVSRQHAEFRWADDQVLVEDLQSSNGTFVGGNRVFGERYLRDGDKVALGNSVMLKFAIQDPIEQSFQEQMYEASLRDGLTQAYNKSFLIDHLESEMSFADRHGTDLGLVLFDLDHFKEINDTHGHLAGDSILRELSDMARSSIRAEDIFARYGGEEFAVALREVDNDGVRRMGERLREMVAAEPFEFEGTEIPVTISVGGATYSTVDPDDPTDMIAAADEALYQAKEAGRNQVCVYRG